ncbi:MAG: hypothetical protein WAN36_10035 [Calditrichia bacterium]
MKLMPSLLTFTLIFCTEVLPREFDFSGKYKQWFVISAGVPDNYDISVGLSYNFGFDPFFQIGLHGNGQAIGSSQITAVTAAYGIRSQTRRQLSAVFVGPAFVNIE